MASFNKTVAVPVHQAIFFSFVVLIGVFAFIFFYASPDDTTPKQYWFLLATGMVPGLVVAIGQYVLEWYEYREISRLRELQIKKILTSRDDHAYYRKLIEASKTSITMQGITASRFLNDFASESSPREDKKVLIAALNRGVRVKILAAHKNFLLDAGQKQKYELAEPMLNALRDKYPNLFSFKYYSHRPDHTIFSADDDCVVGPAFPGVPSQDTPAVHTIRESTYAKPYIENFNTEWASIS